MSTGLVTVYLNNDSGQYIEIKDEYYVPSAPTNIFVSQSDYYLGCFYDHDLNKVYYNKYRDYSKPANSIYSNDASIAQQQYTLSTIVNNTYNIVQNIINPPASQTIDPNSVAAQFKTLTDNYSTLALNYQSLVTEVVNDEANNAVVLNNVNNNTQAIVALGNKIDMLISILRNMNIRNIGDQTFKNGL